MQPDYFNTSPEPSSTAYRKLDVEIEKPNKFTEYISWAGGIILAILFLLWVWLSFCKR